MSETATTPIPTPFPLSLTERGEKLTPDQLRVIMGHPTYQILVGLQEAVYTAVEAEQKADHAYQEARRREWREERERLPCPLQLAYTEAQERSVAAKEERKRVRDQIELARIAGIPCPEKAYDLERATAIHRAAVLAERAARGVAEAAQMAARAAPQEGAEMLIDVERRALLNVEAAREATRIACTHYRRVAYTSELSRFVAKEPRAGRPEKEGTEKAEEAEEAEEET